MSYVGLRRRLGGFGWRSPWSGGRAGTISGILNRRYVLDPCGEVQVWYCRDSNDERFIVLAFRHRHTTMSGARGGGLEDREAASTAREAAKPPHPTILSVYWA